MDAGLLDRAIVIQRGTPTQDASGQEIMAWSTLVSCWAAFIPLSALERYRSQREMASRVATFYIRYYAGITEEDRISFESTYWDIVEVTVIGRKEGVRITAEEKKK